MRSEYHEAWLGELQRKQSRADEVRSRVVNARKEGVDVKKKRADKRRASTSSLFRKSKLDQANSTKALEKHRRAHEQATKEHAAKLVRCP